VATRCPAAGRNDSQAHRKAFSFPPPRISNSVEAESWFMWLARASAGKPHSIPAGGAGAANLRQIRLVVLVAAVREAEVCSFVPWAAAIHRRARPNRGVGDRPGRFRTLPANHRGPLAPVQQGAGQARLQLQRPVERGVEWHLFPHQAAKTRRGTTAWCEPGRVAVSAILPDVGRWSINGPRPRRSMRIFATLNHLGRHRGARRELTRK